MNVGSLNLIKREATSGILHSAKDERGRMVVVDLMNSNNY